MELTGRLADDQVPRSIDELSQHVGPDSTEVCLASNIIEVGIDIDRLSLMTVVGQPKTTSTYNPSHGPDRAPLVGTARSCGHDI
jgi:hypothetical protein